MSIKNKFKRDGYVVVNKVLSKVDVAKLKNISSKILGKFYKKKASWNCKHFNKYLFDIRNKNPEAFSFLYNTLQSNIFLKKIASNDVILKNINYLLKIKDNNISHSICHMRVDSFGDDRNTYDWHQERSYYPQNEDGNGIVVWIALQDIKKKLGPLNALKGSHKAGFVKYKTFKKKNFSTQKKIPVKIIDKYKKGLVEFNIKAGSAIFMNMHTFHKSGKNYSNKFRLSIVARYHDNSKGDFRPFYDTGKYNYSKIKNSDLNFF